MKTRGALISLVAITLLGVVGGIIGALNASPLYRVDAYVIVYELPHELRGLIGPDQAQQLESIYLAGALQDGVVDLVHYQHPEFSQAQIRQETQVTIIAYTPLTRISVAAATPTEAATLANALAKDWVELVGGANNHAYSDALAAAQAHEQDIQSQVAQTQKAIATASKPKSKTPVSGPSLQALQAQLATELTNLTQAENTIDQLNVYRINVTGNSYIVTPADPRQAVRDPDPIKIIAGGTAIGLLLAVVFAFWLIRPQLHAALWQAHSHAKAAE